MAGKRTYDRDKIVPKICERLAKLPSLNKACDELGLPESTARRWADEDESIAARYARAREQGFDAIALEALTISDDGADDPQSRRVRVDTRKWLLSKWSPRKYGDALKLSNDRENPFGALSDDQLDARIAAKLKAIQAPTEETDDDR